MRTSVAVLVAVGLLAGLASADVFNMDGGQKSLEFVVVGDPVNVPDAHLTPTRIDYYGQVDHVFRMGKYDVTAGQYCQFLNAMATGYDIYGLYNPLMGDTSGLSCGCGITRSVSVSPGGVYTYSYGVQMGRENFPVNYVSWADAARFCNWLSNGQSGTTETGSYALSELTGQGILFYDLSTVTRTSGAKYWIPTDDEWYKAAYYKGGGTDAGYWTFPTKSDSWPSNVLSSTGTNNANYYVAAAGGYTDPTNYLTPVGCFAGSPGPYCTFDQGGNVWQWTEYLMDQGWHRGMRGGSFHPTWGDLMYSAFIHPGAVPSYESGTLGFRIAAALEPLLGDINRDGYVNIGDLQALVAAWSVAGRVNFGH